MNSSYEWMGVGGLMWALLAVLVVFAVVIRKLSRK